MSTIQQNVRTFAPVYFHEIAFALRGAACGKTGCTVDRRGQLITPTSGYAVSLRGAECRTSFTPTFDLVLAWIRGVHAAVETGVYFGHWYDAEHGHWYFDASVIVPDLDAARALGREHGQLAVYSFADRTSIAL